MKSILLKSKLIVLRRSEEEGGSLIEEENDVPMILSDGIRLAQILINLISNAIKYTQ
jgi:signal transduction histidine kinase